MNVKLETWRLKLNHFILTLLGLFAVQGWLQPGLPASPRLEMVPELGILWLLRDELSRGLLFADWNPLEFGGFPLRRYIAFPLYLLVGGLSLLSGLSLETLYKAGVILAVIASGWAMHAWVWALTRRRGAALVAGAIYLLSPFHLHVGVEAWIHNLFWAILPLPFLVYEQGRRSAHFRRVAMGVVLALCPVISLELTLILSPFLGIYLLWREGTGLWQGGRRPSVKGTARSGDHRRTRSDFRTIVADWLIVALIAVGLSAFFTLPGAMELKLGGIEARHQADPVVDLAFNRNLSVSPSLLLAAVSNRLRLPVAVGELPAVSQAFSGLNAWYLGVVAMGLALLGMTRWRESGLAVVLLLLSLAFCAGPLLPVNPFARLPLVGGLLPFRAMIVAGFALAWLAGWGVAILEERIVLPTGRALLALGLVLLIVVDFRPVTAVFRTLPAYHPAEVIAAYQWAATQGSGYRLWGYNDAKLGVRDGYLQTYTLTYAPVARFDGYFDVGASYPAWLVTMRARPRDGALPFLPVALQLYSVRYVVVDQSLPGAEAAPAVLSAGGYDRIAYRGAGVMVVEHPNPRPFARLYPQVATYTGRDVETVLTILPTLARQQVALVHTPAIVSTPMNDPGDDDYLIQDDAVPAGPRTITASQIHQIPPGSLTAVAWERPGPEEIRIHLDRPGPGLLVVGESWYPHWQAWVDGHPTPVLVADGALLGVRLQGGETTVVFRYVKPAYWWAGYIMTLLTLLALAGRWGVMAGRARIAQR